MAEQSLARLLRAWRERALLTQEQLASKTGLGIRTIRRLESDQLRRPRADSLRLIADSLDLTDEERALLAAAHAGLASPLGAVPRQLPADVAGFAGRTGQLRELDALLDHVTSAVVISVITGTAGVGKSALAVHWAHSITSRFPDGQLYVDLRGFAPGGAVPDTSTAVRGFLDALGVKSEGLPADLDAQAALYRSLINGKQVLVVLDNARDTEQIRPLLPGSPGCLVVTTSRNDLTGLVSRQGAQPLILDGFTTSEAHELLLRRLGEGRLAAEPEAEAEIIELCVRLPLALAIIAARAALSPSFSLRALAHQLRETRLNALAGSEPETDVRGVFSWSYQQLTLPAQRLFRLLGLHPGPDISTPAAASLTGMEPADTRPLLSELTHAHLVTEHVPGRYRFHDLLRAFATELSAACETENDRRVVIRRMLDHYLHTAYAADRLLAPQAELLTLAPRCTGVKPEQLAGEEQAMVWLAAEHAVLLAALTQAAAIGFDSHAWQLAWSLHTFLSRQGHRHNLASVWQVAVDATQKLDDLKAEASARRHLASAYTRLGRFDNAHTHLNHALHLSKKLGDCASQAHTHLTLAPLLERQGDYVEALDHSRRALDLYRSVDHRAGQAQALNGVGWCHAKLGDHRQAIAWCEQALPLLQELGNREGEAHTWDSLGYAHHHLHQYKNAAACYQHALDLHRELGNRYYLAATLTHLGDTEHAARELDAARATWREALVILEELDHTDADALRAKLENVRQH